MAQVASINVLEGKKGIRSFHFYSGIVYILEFRLFHHLYYSKHPYSKNYCDQLGYYSDDPL